MLNRRTRRRRRKKKDKEGQLYFKNHAITKKKEYIRSSLLHGFLKNEFFRKYISFLIPLGERRISVRRQLILGDN